MITKYTNDFADSADCFSALLDDFIKEMKDKEAHKNKPRLTANGTPDYYEFVPYTSQGTTYSIPKCNKDISWIINGDIFMSFAIDNADTRNIPYDTTTFFASGNMSKMNSSNLYALGAEGFTTSPLPSR